MDTQVHAAVFTVAERINTPTTRVRVPLAQPLLWREEGDSPFETFMMRALNARRLAGDLPAELEPYRGWYIRDIGPVSPE